MSTGRIRMRTRRSVLALIAALFTLHACGGGGNGGGNAGTTTPVRFSIDWGARSRTISAPSSALSATLTLANAGPAGGDFHFTVNRDPAPAAYTGNYTTTTRAKIGTWPLTVRFFALADG